MVIVAIMVVSMVIVPMVLVVLYGSPVFFMPLIAMFFNAHVAVARGLPLPFAALDQLVAVVPVRSPVGYDDGPADHVRMFIFVAVHPVPMPGAIVDDDDAVVPGDPVIAPTPRTI